MTNKNLNFVFFGTSEFAVKILDKLIENGYVPSLVITTPDKPKGRKMIMTPPPVKVFAQAHNLKIIQPERLAGKPPSGGLIAKRRDLLIVGFLGEEKTGVTIMLMDEQVDHRQILSQKEFEARSTKHEFRNKFQIQNSENLKLNAKQLEEKLAELGGQMLVDVIPKWI